MSGNDKELQRVLKNPDNLIVSDSLLGRIDFEDEALPEISVDLTCGSNSISGKFLGYSVDASSDPEELLAISFLVSDSFLDSVLKMNPGAGCTIKIKKNIITGSMFKIEVDSLNTELQITVFLKRYN